MSTLEVSNLNDGTTTVATTLVTNGTSRAWANLSSSATRNSFNASSFVDNGTGDYSLSLTNAMTDENYIGVSGGFSGAARTTVMDTASTSSVFRMHIYISSSGALNDSSSVFSVFGDLA